MSVADSKPTTPPSRQGPVIRCLPLADFDESSLDAVRAAFAAATPCALGQAWRAELESGFAPGEVRTGWRRDSLLVFAELTDHDIFTRATLLNQRMWELGDTFEMFLQPSGSPGYVELHVTPNNQHLQLRFADASSVQSARKSGSIENLLIEGAAFKSRTWVQPENRKWFALAQIPVALVGGSRESAEGGRWRFSFSRYDHTRGGGEPMISSTSPHPVEDFHSQQEWGELTFATGAKSK